MDSKIFVPVCCLVHLLKALCCFFFLAESEPENIETGSLPDSVQDPTITSFGDQPSIQSNMR